RLAEVAPDRAREEAAVLDDPRIVEAHGLAEARDVLGRRVGGQEQRGGIAREMQNREHDHGYAEEDEHGLPDSPQDVRLDSAAGAKKWPPHSPILPPARPCRTRPALARSIMLSLPTSPRHGPRTPPSFRRRVRAGRAPLSRARSCSPCPRRLAMAPALPHPCAGASVPDAHRSHTYN